MILPPVVLRVRFWAPFNVLAKEMFPTPVPAFKTTAPPKVTGVPHVIFCPLVVILPLSDVVPLPESTKDPFKERATPLGMVSNPE